MAEHPHGDFQLKVTGPLGKSQREKALVFVSRETTHTPLEADIEKGPGCELGAHPECSSSGSDLGLKFENHCSEQRKACELVVEAEPKVTATKRGLFRGRKVANTEVTTRGDMITHKHIRRGPPQGHSRQPGIQLEQLTTPGHQHTTHKTASRKKEVVTAVQKRGLGGPASGCGTGARSAVSRRSGHEPAGHGAVGSRQRGGRVGARRRGARGGAGRTPSSGRGRRVLREEKGSGVGGWAGGRARGGEVQDRRPGAQTRNGRGRRLPGAAAGGGGEEGGPARHGRRTDGATGLTAAGRRSVSGQRRQFRRAGSYHRARAGGEGRGGGRGGAERSGSGPDAPARPPLAPGRLRARAPCRPALPARGGTGAERATGRGSPPGRPSGGRPAGSFEKRARTKAAAASRRPARAQPGRGPRRMRPGGRGGGGGRGPGAAVSPAGRGRGGAPTGM
nr:spidroin-1-like [Camelus dromedarius]